MKRYFPDSIGTDTLPTLANPAAGVLTLPAPNSRMRREKVVALFTNLNADVTSIVATKEANTEVVIICTANTGTKKLTDGSNLKLAGDFTPGAGDTIELVCDGTNYYETGRSNN